MVQPAHNASADAVLPGMHAKCLMCKKQCLMLHRHDQKTSCAGSRCYASGQLLHAACTGDMSPCRHAAVHGFWRLGGGWPLCDALLRLLRLLLMVLLALLVLSCRPRCCCCCRCRCCRQLSHLMPAVYVAQVALLRLSAISALPSFCMIKRRGAVPRPAVLVVHCSTLALS